MIISFNIHYIYCLELIINKGFGANSESIEDIQLRYLVKGNSLIALMKLNDIKKF
jgi:hypothetical protein